MEKLNLKDIKSPAELKALSLPGLAALCDELRGPFLRKVAAHGGHVGPNLGVVEATVALHYVFNAPEDKLVFDVSHQTYIHKMLTGRISAFLDPAKYDDVTGYSSPAESEYDLFEIGHTSTSISLATGLAKARDLTGGKENVVAFIGDASLGGGMALEGLNYAPELHSNIIVVLNDNQMSIAENHGALYSHLADLRRTGGTAPDNIFKALGYEYIYVADGNDISSLVEAFRAAKDAPRAVLVHINTVKGRGYAPAEADKERFHYSAPFSLADGKLTGESQESYVDAFVNLMVGHIPHHRDTILMTAGTPGAMGLERDIRESLGGNYVDVGICEQDCIAMAAGAARGGLVPVVGMASSFVQRAFDQMSHDVGINNLPVVIVEFFAGVFGIPDMTHLGFFDIPLISNIPNFVFLAPATKEEYVAALRWAMEQRESPVVVRTPGGKPFSDGRPVNPDFFRYEVARHGEKIALIGAGTFYRTALEAAALMEQKGLHPTVINPRNLSQLDVDTLSTLRGYDTVITLEDGIVDGGFGQKIAAYFGDTAVKVKCLGLKKEFIDDYVASDVLRANGLTPAQIAALV